MSFKIFLDKNGIPCSAYGNYKGLQIGTQQSILCAAERGLLLWNRYESTEQNNVLLSYSWWKKLETRGYEPTTHKSARAQMINCANWLLDQVED